MLHDPIALLSSYPHTFVTAQILYLALDRAKLKQNKKKMVCGSLPKALLYHFRILRIVQTNLLHHMTFCNENLSARYEIP